jgi:hypothetical protein
MAEAVVMNKVRVVNDRVLILDDDYEGPAAEARYVRKLVDELLPEAEHFHADLDIRRLSISELSAIIRESVDALALMWAGLEPENRERLEGRCWGWVGQTQGRNISASLSGRRGWWRGDDGKTIQSSNPIPYRRRELRLAPEMGA